MASAIDRDDAIFAAANSGPWTSYKELLTDDAWTRDKSVPANRTQLSETKSFEDAFANAFFRFSHYGKTNTA